MDLFDLKKWNEYPQSFQHEESIFIDEVCIHSKLVSSKNSLFIALKGRASDGHKHLEEAFRNGARFAVVSEEHPLEERKDLPKLIYVKDPIKALQSLAYSYRKELTCHIVAIMGSYGKTLLKDLLFNMCNAQKPCVASPESFNSQIGVPLSIFNISKKHSYAFIELAASESGEIGTLHQIVNPTEIIFTSLSNHHPYIYRNNGQLKNEYNDLINQLQDKTWVLADASIQSKRSHIHRWDKIDEDMPHLILEEPPSPRLCKCSYKYKAHKKTFACSPSHSLLIDLSNIAIKAAYLLGFDPIQALECLMKYEFQYRQREVWKSPVGTTFQNDPYVSCPMTLLNSLNQFKKLSILGKKWLLFNEYRDLGSFTPHHYQVTLRLIQTSGLDYFVHYGKQLPENFERDLKALCPNIQFASFINFKKALKYVQSTLSFEDAILITGHEKISIDQISNNLSISISDNQLLVDLTAIKQNVDLLKTKLGPKKRIMPIIKSQAYGTDSVIVALFLESSGIDILGVAYVSEALQLRKNGVKTNLFVLHTSPNELEEVVKWNLEIGVNDEGTLIQLQDLAKEKDAVVKVHLHVDTGMTRLGCLPSEALTLARRIYFSSHIEMTGLMTHFAQSEDPSGDGFTIEQAESLTNLYSALKKLNLNPPWIHAENSAAVARFSFNSFNMVRVGLALFGLQPSSKEISELPLKPALALTSKVSTIHTCKKGDTVSYGRNYTVKNEQETIAVIPLGYFDGIHRHYAENGKVMIQNKLAPVVGSICMDFMMVNISHLPNVQVGDPVLVFGVDRFGNELSPQDFAKGGHTIAHELITCLGPRIQRIFTSDEHAHPIPQIKEQAQWTAKQTSKK